jgi:hypothetical protein
MYLDIFEQIFILRPFAPKHLRRPLVAYIKDMCKNSGFLRDYLLENEHLLHPDELLNLVKSARGQSSPVPSVTNDVGSSDPPTGVGG